MAEKTQPFSVRPEILWCSNRRRRAGNGWCFPPKVDRLLREVTAGKRVGQFFGGLSGFGTKLDIDRTTKPHVLGDAWLAPFVKDAFDVVILDPPYVELNQHMYLQLLTQASWCAREHVIWFHTMWLANGRAGRLERGWRGARWGHVRGPRAAGVPRAGGEAPTGSLFRSRARGALQPMDCRQRPVAVRQTAAPRCGSWESRLMCRHPVRARRSSASSSEVM